MGKKIKFNTDQLSLPFSETQASLFSYENREKTFWTLASLCFLAVVAYIYALNMTAHHVAERASLERESTRLTTELATLEFQYIAGRDSITLETAKQMGFKEVSAPLYVAREADKAVSFNK